MKRIITRIFLLCLLLPTVTTAHAQNGEEPQYRVNFVSMPEGICTISAFFWGQELIYHEGDWVNLFFHRKEGWKFDRIMSADTVLVRPEAGTDPETLEAAFYMPAHDVNITAYLIYDPASPDDPNIPPRKYRLSFKSEPENMGYYVSYEDELSYNGSDYTDVYPGTRCCIVVTSRENHYKFREWQQGEGLAISGDTCSFVMPEHDLTITALFDYNPDSPAGPNDCNWNKDTGDLYVNNMTPGNLSSTINQALVPPNSYDSPPYEQVKTITVSGLISKYDCDAFQSTSYRNYNNLTTIDLSRTNGLMELPRRAFSELPALKTIVLPASVAAIKWEAFYRCPAIESITCFATTPPILEENAFEDIAEGCYVYVPAESVPLYMEADGWKQMEVMPITVGISSLSVSLPPDISADNYKDMFLELVNVKTGQMQRYVLTGRDSYTFTGLIHGTEYNLYIRNARGSVLGRVDGIQVVDGDVQAAFTTLQTPRDLTLTLLTPDGKDVTGEATVTWFDKKGNYLQQGSTLAGQAEGTKALCQVRLPESLGKQYLFPSDTALVVGTVNTVIITLTPIPQTTLNGTVTDAATGKPIRDANISMVQQLNGQFSVTLTTKSDREGRWTLTAWEGPGTRTVVTASASGYMNQVKASDTPPAGLYAFSMEEIAGTVINLDLRYQPSVADGEEAVIEDDYAGHDNVTYSVYDETRQQELTGMSLQYPVLALPESLEQGTKLRVTATSTNDMFMPVTTTCYVNSQDQATAAMTITQLGIVKASFSQTDNSAVCAMLYDEAGRLVGRYFYDEAALTIDDKPDGRYTLVSMGESRLFNGINTLDGLSETGLQEGRDYVSTRINLRSGRIMTVRQETIPTFDETTLYYTGENTRFTLNKNQVTVGNYLTLRGQVDFKPSVAGDVSNVALVFDLPEGCSLVNGSVMAGSTLAYYSLDGNRISVPVEDMSDVVRLCVIPTESGSYEPSASVTFTKGGGTFIQPIGSAVFEAKDLAISVPSKASHREVTIAGMGLPGSKVQVYDGDVLIGQADILANGHWTAECRLDKAYNLSEHGIYARITTPGGIEMLTATNTLTTVSGTLVPVVNMSFWNALHNGSEVLKWDFRTGTVSRTNYPVPWTEMSLTFDIDFKDGDMTVNDTTIISNVTLNILCSDQSVLTLPTHYSQRKGRWTAQCDFTTAAMPVNLHVDYSQDTKVELDRAQLDDMISSAEDAYEEDAQFIKDIYAQFDEQAVSDLEPVYNELEQLLSLETTDEATEARIDSLTRIIVGDSLMDEAMKQRTDFSDIEAMFAAIDRDNPDVEAVLAASEKLNARIREMEAKADEVMIEQLAAVLATKIEEVTAFIQQQRDETVSQMEYICRTDTAELERPEGDLSFTLPGNDIDKSYTKQQLGNVNKEQLLKEGYMEISLTDGTSLLIRKDEEGISLIDMATKTLYAMKTDNKLAGDLSAARRQAGAMDKLAKLFDVDCINDYRKLSEKVFKFNEQAKGSTSDWATFSTVVGNVKGTFDDIIKTARCLYDSGLSNMDEAMNKFFKNGKQAVKEYWEEAKKQIPGTKESIARQRAYQKDLQRGKKSLEMNQDLLEICLKRKDELGASVVEKLERQLEETKSLLGHQKEAIENANKKMNKIQGLLKSLEIKIKELGNVISKTIPNIQKATMNILKKLPQTLDAALKAGKAVIHGAGIVAKFVGTVVGAVFQVAPLVLLIIDYTADMNAWMELEKEVKGYLPCEGDRDKWEQIYADYKSNCTTEICISIAHVTSETAALVLDAVSIPVVTPWWWVSTALDIGNIIASVFHPKSSEEGRDFIRTRLSWLNCNKKPTQKPDKKSTLIWNDRHWEEICFGPTTNCPNVTPIIDPSGYVYEAVPSNRLEGVKATCYYRETVEDIYGDLHEVIDVWDAAQYAQENPLFTDAEGKYAWDVPQGLWQVKFEKEGYETTRSEWLPVPPPQLEVNVGMRQTVQPLVKRVMAYPEGVELHFDKYMKPETLIPDNILLSVGGKQVEGRIVLIDEEQRLRVGDGTSGMGAGSKDTSGTSFASKLRVEMPDGQPLQLADKVQLTVRKAVESYAGIPMENDYTQELDVELRVLTLEADSMVYMADGSRHTLQVRALPVEAAKGRKLSVASMAAEIATADADVLTLDDNGQAELTVTAEGIGSAAIAFQLAGSDLAGFTIIQVRDSANMTVETPQSSRLSGTTIYKGSEIRLSCATAGATILYTLDGSCPCDPQNPAIRVYSSPLMVTTDDIVIRAMAIANGLADSEVAEFRYKAIDNPVGIATPQKGDQREATSAPTLYYRVNGQRIPAPERGISIVRRPEKTVKQVTK